jgi:hypothetical protein
MRLTLRTMLAYLDDVLDPADADAIRAKIEESDFASGLVDRLQGVLKKLRMESPKLDGKGMGNDANTVAEYLDSALTQDRVAEFERVCLESDKHLCEVAACHQILTLVLGKAADVPTDLRQRIYALGDPAQAAAHPAVSRADGRKAAHGEAHAAGAAEGANGKPVPPPPLEVPEYLRSGRETSLWPFVLVASIALVVTMAILWQMKGLREPRSGQDLASTTTEPTEPTSGTQSNTPANTPGTADSSNTGAGGEAPAVAATTPTTDPSDAGPASSPATTETPTEGTGRPAVAADGTGRPAAAATPSVPETPEVASPPPTGLAAATVNPEPPTVKSPVPPAESKPVEVGRFTSARYATDAQLFATLNRMDGLWYAKQPREIITAGEQLIVLPPYRPQVTLPPTVTLTFAGEGSLKVDQPDENGVPRATIDYGRFIAETPGKPGGQVELTLAGIVGVVTLVDADSVLAVRVGRWVGLGTDPESAEGQPVVELYNANGRVSFQQPDQPKVDIPTSHVHYYFGSDLSKTHGPFQSPEWIDYKSVKPIDREAAILLEKLVSNERPLNVTLQETMKDRRVEVRALAARSLAALGEFEAVLRELSDPNQYSFWQGEFEALRHALSRSPETAAKVRETIGLARSADAKDIYRLLWGFNNEQLNAGAATQLIKYLESEQMDIRVLAHVNLVAITGTPGFYRPERSPAQMKTAIQNWRDKKEKGQIIYKPMEPSALDVYRTITPAVPGTK